MEHSAEVRELRQCMDAFLEERCAEKLKGSGDEAERAKVKARFQREAWLADAAEKALKIQIVQKNINRLSMVKLAEEQPYLISLLGRHECKVTFPRFHAGGNCSRNSER